LAGYKKKTNLLDLALVLLSSNIKCNLFERRVGLAETLLNIG